MTTTAVQHLQLVVHHWQDLHALRTTRPHDAWPPPSLQTYLRTVDEYDPQDRSAPVRLHVVDTIRAVEGALLDLADQTAATAQRPVIHAPAAGRGWSDDAHRQALLLAARDAADPRRWQYTGARTAPAAATWLTARLANHPGPFRRLTDGQRERIALIAAGAADRVQHALGTARRTAALGRDCACGGGLILEGGDGQPPAVVCQSCGRRVGDMAAVA